jgi:hypothetical protein
MGAWLTGSQVKESLMAGLAGGGGILVTSAVLQRLPFPADWQPSTTSRVKNLLAVAVGVAGGRMLYDRNRDAAMGFMGGVGGLAIAQLLASFAPDTLSTSLSGGGLSSADLAALEAAVATNSPSWRAGELSAPMVSERQLAATGTTQEDLADYDRYMSGGGVPAPSF